LSNVGNAEVDTAQKKYGTGSLLVTSDGDYVSASDSDDWTDIDDVFTLECFVRFDSIPPSGDYINFFAHVVAVGVNYWSFYFENNKLHFQQNVLFGGDKWHIESPFSPSEDTWYHVVCMRDGESWTLAYKEGRFEDGEGLGYRTDTDNGSLHSFSGGFRIGWSLDYSGSVWMDEFRISDNNRYNYAIP